MTDSDNGERRRTSRWRQRELVRNGLHLAALSSFAIAWQYFEPLRKAGAAVSVIGLGARPGDLVAFALLMVVVPPAGLVLAEWLAGLASVRLRDALHLVFIGALVGLITWQAINESSPGVSPKAVEGLSLAAGGLAAFAYARLAILRTYLSALSIAPPVVLALFLVFSPLSTLVLGSAGESPVPRAASGAPVVMLVLDEFPLTSLMNERRRIDAIRYPSFARLAGDATWYRNVASIGDYTQTAVPSILTGRAERPDTLPVTGDHTRTLFTLLGGSYRLDVSEQVTDLCRSACPVQLDATAVTRVRALLHASVDRIPALPSWVRWRLAARLRSKQPYLGDGSPQRRSVRRHLRAGQDVRFERFLETIRSSRRPTLHYAHLLLPHRPWFYFPQGKRYGDPRGFGLLGDPFGRWPRGPAAAARGYQRHLLQVAYMDALLGRLLRRLRAIGLYDRALIVVVADHGASFRPGDQSRRLTRTNAGDIASVPLIVKAPGQRRGRIDDGYVQTTDVLPTIASQLHVRVPWRLEGRPASGVGHSRRTLAIWREDDGARLVFGRRTIERQRDATLRRKVALFGSGRRGSLFALGPHPELLGRRLASLPVAAQVNLRATIDAAERFRAVDLGAPILPANVTGTLAGGRPHSRPFVVALNGRVAATGWSMVIGGIEQYTALVPPSSLRAGANRVEVLAQAERNGRVSLAPADALE